MSYKKVLLTASTGFFSSFLLKSVGGIDTPLSTLLIFMCIDFISGIILSAFFKKSIKTENGKLSSNVGAKGIAKKGLTLLVIIMAYQLDMLRDTDYIRNGAIMSYLLIEGISICENLKLMGVKLPKIISDALEVEPKN